MPGNIGMSHDRKRCERADANREHHDAERDLKTEDGGVDPLRVAEIVLVPMQREAGRRKLQIHARAERDWRDDEQRYDEKSKDDDRVGPQEAVRQAG